MHWKCKHTYISIIVLLSISVIFCCCCLSKMTWPWTLPVCHSHCHNQNGWKQKQKKNRINTRQEKMRNEVEMITCSARYNQKKARLGVVCILYHLPNVCLSLSTFVKSVSWTWLNGILVVSPKQNEKHKNCSIEHGILLAGYVLFLEFCFYYSLR